MGMPTLTSRGEKREKEQKTGLEVNVGVPTLTSRGEKRGKELRLKPMKSVFLKTVLEKCDYFCFPRRILGITVFI